MKKKLRGSQEVEKFGKKIINNLIMDPMEIHNKAWEGAMWCDDHCIWYWDEPICPSCKSGEPGFVRPRGQVNPDDEKYIADLEKRGLIEPRDKEVVKFEKFMENALK